MTGAAAPLLIFDGDCGFCTSCANWLAARWRAADARAVPWQTLDADELVALSLTRDDVRSAVGGSPKTAALRGRTSRSPTP